MTSTSSITAGERRGRVEELLSAFGLQNQADTIVGTPVRRGISGGQKRRLSIASQLITAPKVLFLDEPTSGLDSTAGYEVIKYLREVAQRHKVIDPGVHEKSTLTLDSSLLSPVSTNHHLQHSTCSTNFCSFLEDESATMDWCCQSITI